MSVANLQNTNIKVGDYQIHDSGNDLLLQLEEKVNQAAKFDRPSVSGNDNLLNESMSPEKVRNAVAEIAQKVQQPIAGMNFNSIV